MPRVRRVPSHGRAIRGEVLNVKIDKRGELMDIKMDQRELEEAVTMWLSSKHGISTTKVSDGGYGGSKAYWKVIHHGESIAVSAVAVTITNVEGTSPGGSSGGPYRTNAT
jgi:hypothetical protein